ncbi:MAG: ParB/RepB/Spo0J family partition protein [Thalassospira sp.]|uniref:ParB/RepB/Spo0J family partition protein n=1 Tax=Thalassospira sp. TaxID=1912094 RepID=UPI003A863652
MKEPIQATVELSEAVEIPWHQLKKGSANVRTVKPNNEADAALIANIADIGVLENLIVSPLDDEGTAFGVHAGGRRWSAIGENVRQGVLPDSYPVPCRIQTGGSLIAVSLAENLHAPMHPADEFQAFDAMRQEGADVPAIAARFGLPEPRVKQRLKLGQVAKRILNAYRAETIDLQTVMAFTLASSQKEQLRVFKELGHQCYAYRVRQAFTGDASIASDDRLVKYIGLSAYQAAGGSLVTDLFAEHDHLSDRGLVEQLALSKLEKVAARIKSKEGWGEVRCTTDPYFPAHEFHHVEPEPVDLPAELTERLQTLIDTQHQLHDSCEAGWTDDAEAQDEALTDAIDALEAEIDAYRTYTDAQKAQGICFITISNAGKTQIARGYLSRSAHKRTEHNDGASETPNTTLPQALITDLGAHRQQAAQAALLDDPNLASDLLLYTLCHDVLQLGWQHKALRLSVDVASPMGSGFEDTTPDLHLKKIRSKLPTEWMTIERPGERFAALRKLTPKRKQALLTYCVSVSFTTGVASDDTVAEAALTDLAPDYASYWRPTGEGYFKRLKHAALITLGTELFGEEWYTEHEHDKKGALVEWFHRFFVGPLPKDISPELKQLRTQWVPREFIQT